MRFKLMSWSSGWDSGVCITMFKFIHSPSLKDRSVTAPYLSAAWLSPPDVPYILFELQPPPLVVAQDRLTKALKAFRECMRGAGGPIEDMVEIFVGKPGMRKKLD
jgi:hypothetical protein